MDSRVSPPLPSTPSTLSSQYLPSLPGYQLTHLKDNHHKKQTWGFCGDTRIEYEEGVTHDKCKFVQVPRKNQNPPQNPNYTTTTHTSFLKQEASIDLVPSWDAYENQVLRFFGYWKEHLDEHLESAKQNFHTHKVILYYYLEDDTLQIVEPREENSGRWQGTLIRRHRIQLSPSQASYISPKDIIVGQTLHLYGKTIFLTDCDPFTRDWYQGQDASYPRQGPAHPLPSSPSNALPLPSSFVISKSYDKRYREVALGGCQINENMQQFMQLDGKVCRFFCILDDYSNPCHFERRYFTLLFFLADDSIELREQFIPNSGRCEFPIFLRRKQIPKSQFQVKGVQSPPPKTTPLAAGEKEPLVSIQDFQVGYTIRLQHQDFLIHDADEYTREYFQKTLSSPLLPPVSIALPSSPRPPRQIAPYNGFGSYEDSLMNCLDLIPKNHTHTQQKSSSTRPIEKDVLRFIGALVNPSVQDKNRRFVISFFCSDGCIQIHEPFVRNSGIVGGRVLQREKVLKKQENLVGKTERRLDYVGKEDLREGYVLATRNGTFLLLESDERTKKILACGEEGVLEEYWDLKSVVEQLRERVRSEKKKVREIFLHWDEGSKGVLDEKDMKRLLEKYNLPYYDELVVLGVLRHFDLNEDGVVSYNEFADVVLERDVVEEGERQGMGRVRYGDGVGGEEKRGGEYGYMCGVRREQRMMSQEIKEVTRAIQEAIYIRPNCGTRLLKELVRMTSSQYVSCKQIQEALKNLGILFGLDEVEQCVSYLLPGEPLDRVQHTQFVQALSISYHDLPHSK